MITQKVLDTLNIPQEKSGNRKTLETMGGIDGLLNCLQVNLDRGLNDTEISFSTGNFGKNVFPDPPSESFLHLLFQALSDSTLIILMIAAVVSIILGVIIEDPKLGWIEGFAILIAVFLVSMIAATNDYSKELQFRSLQKLSHQAEKTSVFRNHGIEQISPDDIVVGDILILQVRFIIIVIRIYPVLCLKLCIQYFII